MDDIEKEKQGTGSFEEKPEKPDPQPADLGSCGCKKSGFLELRQFGSAPSVSHVPTTSFTTEASCAKTCKDEQQRETLLGNTDHLAGQDTNGLTAKLKKTKKSKFREKWMET